MESFRVVVMFARRAGGGTVIVVTGAVQCWSSFVSRTSSPQKEERRHGAGVSRHADAATISRG